MLPTSINKATKKTVTIIPPKDFSLLLLCDNLLLAERRTSSIRCHLVPGIAQLFYDIARSLLNFSLVTYESFSVYYFQIILFHLFILSDFFEMGDISKFHVTYSYEVISVGGLPQRYSNFWHLGK